MPTHVLLSTLTTEGRQAMHAHPERLDAVNYEIEKLGCRELGLNRRCSLATKIHMDLGSGSCRQFSAAALITYPQRSDRI